MSKSWIDHCCSLWHLDLMNRGPPSSPPQYASRKRYCSSCHSTTGRREQCTFPPGFLLFLKALIKKLPWNQKTWGMMLWRCSWLLVAKWSKGLQERVTAELSVLVLLSNNIHVPPQVLVKAVSPLDTSRLFLLCLSILLGAIVHPEAIQRKTGWLRKRQLSGVINTGPRLCP